MSRHSTLRLLLVVLALVVATAALGAPSVALAQQDNDNHAARNDNADPGDDPIRIVGGTTGPDPFLTSWTGFPIVGEFIVQKVADAVAYLIGKVVEGMRQLIAGLLADPRNNYLFRTPPAASYGLQPVREFQAIAAAVGNALLALLLVGGGFGVMIGASTGIPYHTAAEILPRFVVGAVLVNTASAWTEGAIRLNNAICAALDPRFLPGWDSAPVVDPALGVGYLIALGGLLIVYFVVVLLLLIHQVARLALVCVLLVLAPVGVACWLLPQTQRWAQLWFVLFFGTVFSQVGQVAALAVGAALATGMGVGGEQGGGPPLLSVTIGIASVLLAMKMPSLFHAAVGGPSLRTVAILVGRGGAGRAVGAALGAGGGGSGGGRVGGAVAAAPRPVAASGAGRP